MKNIYKTFFFLLLLISNFAPAQIKLPAIISDNMILQQNKKIALWGWAKPGEKINIQLAILKKL